MLGVLAASPRDLAAKCEGSVLAQRLGSAAIDRERSKQMTAADVVALIDGGMSVGFHTVTHPVLSDLTPAELDDALSRGRRELAQVCRTPVTLLAYPHGRANARVARAAEAAGYDAAFAAGGRPIGAHSNRFLLGRWEPGAVELDDFVAGVALRLNRAVAARR
jgi:peptidoglycan/xylan/chitin deacetylase (PgdA/CDA1 family)